VSAISDSYSRCLDELSGRSGSDRGRSGAGPPTRAGVRMSTHVAYVPGFFAAVAVSSRV